MSINNVVFVNFVNLIENASLFGAFCIHIEQHFLAGKVRGEFKEIVHTIATVQTIDVSYSCSLSIARTVEA